MGVGVLYPGEEEKVSFFWRVLLTTWIPLSAAISFTLFATCLLIYGRIGIDLSVRFYFNGLFS